MSDPGPVRRPRKQDVGLATDVVPGVRWLELNGQDSPDRLVVLTTPVSVVEYLPQPESQLLGVKRPDQALHLRDVEAAGALPGGVKEGTAIFGSVDRDPATPEITDEFVQDTLVRSSRPVHSGEVHG
jgi:hypothetical protein